MKKFDIENGILYHYNGNNPHVVIPDGVRSIGELAFCNCNRLTSIEIPNSVTSIGYNAFQGCKNLKSIKIPDGVTEIGEAAFCYCYGLSTVNISNSIKSIGSGAFKGIKDVIPQYNANGSLRAFKAFNKDWTCRNFQYEVGKTYHQNGTIICCKNGFHACTNPLNVFNYYHGELSNLHFAEVELSGIINFGYTSEKVAASDIKIVRELTVQDLCEIYNLMEKEK